jgi:hypothetical protein
MRKHDKVILVVLILVHLIPIWGFKYFPSQDGPAHLENAVIIRDYDDPDASLFRDYYEIHMRPSANLFGHMILVGLVSVFPLLIAEKILLSGYIILLPLSVRYTLGAIRPGSQWLAVLSFPFIYNFPFQMGFYYFSYSLPVFFFLVGYWARDRSRFRIRELVSLALLTLLLYFTHPVSLVMAWIVMAVVGIVWTLASSTGSALQHHPGRGTIGAAIWKWLLGPLLAFLPTMVLMAVFLQESGTERSGALPLDQTLRGLAKLSPLVSHDVNAVWFSTAFAGLFAVVAVFLVISKIVTRTRDRRDGLALAALVCTAVCLFGPNRMAGGTFITARLLLFPFFVTILWFGAQSFPTLVRRIVIGATAVIALGLVGVHAGSFAELNEYLDEYLSGTELIEPNSRLAPLLFSQHGHSPEDRQLSRKVKPFLHASGYIAARKHVIEFLNYEAAAHHFPVDFRDGMDPGPKTGVLVLEPPILNPAMVRGPIDYILVWNIREEQRDHKRTVKIMRELDAGFELIHESPKGLMQLYKARE